jgi:hypothetical protein
MPPKNEMRTTLPPLQPSSSSVVSLAPVPATTMLAPLKLKRATSLPGKLEAIKGSRALFWFRPRGCRHADQEQKATHQDANIISAGKDGERVVFRRRPLVTRSFTPRRLSQKDEEPNPSIEYSDDESGHTESFDDDDELFGLSFLLDYDE